MGTGQSSKSKLYTRLIPVGKHGGGKIQVISSPSQQIVTLTSKEKSPVNIITNKNFTAAQLHSQNLDRKEKVSAIAKARVNQDYWKKEIKTRAESFKGSTTEETVNNIYNYVQKRNAHVVAKYPRDLKQVWEQRIGDCTDRANLIVEMLKTNNIDARKVHGYTDTGVKHDLFEYKTDKGYTLMKEKQGFNMKGTGLWLDSGKSKASIKQKTQRKNKGKLKNTSVVCYNLWRC